MNITSLLRELLPSECNELLNAKYAHQLSNLILLQKGPQGTRCSARCSIYWRDITTRQDKLRALRTASIVHVN
jgi:hypothetical protein